MWSPTLSAGTENSRRTLFALPAPRISGSDVASVRTEPTATSEALERMRWRPVVADVFCEFSGEQHALFETLWDHFAEARHWVVFDDVVTTWHELARRGYQVAIASNFDQRLEQICRDLFPLSDCRHVFPSSRVGWSEPSPAFFRAIEETLQLEPAQLFLNGLFQ